MTTSDIDGMASVEAPSGPGGSSEIDGSVWLVVARAIAPVRAQAILVLVVATLAAFTEAAGIGLIVPLMAALLGVGDIPDAGPSIGLVQGWLSELFPSQDIILTVCIALAVMYVLKTGLIILSNYLQHSFIQQSQARWAWGMLDRYMRWDYKHLLLQSRGTLINNASHEVWRASKALKYGLVLVTEVLVAVSIYVVMLLVNWQMTLTLSVVAGLIGGSFWAVSHRFSLSTGNEVLRRQQDITSRAEEALRAAREVKVFGLEQRIVKGTRWQAEVLARINVRFRVLVELPAVMSELLVVTIILSVLVIAQMGSPDGAALLLPVLAFFAIAAQKMFQKVSRAFSGSMSMTQFVPSLVLMPVTNAAGSVRTEARVDSVDTEPLRGDIELTDVTFAYDEDRGPVLQRVSMAIPMGSTVGILGTTGSGKSTILDIMCGFYRDYEGTISVGGQDLRGIPFEDWRRGVGLVGQQPVLFRGTIRDNITLLESSGGDAATEEAARKAHAHEFISRLPSGYDTVISDEGALSVGQKQRIAIARVIYRDPWLYLFDEATSSLDVTTEGFVQEFVASLRGKSTVVIVTHRHSNVREADNVYVLEQSRVVEQGQFKDLRSVRQPSHETSPTSVVIP